MADNTKRMNVLYSSDDNYAQFVVSNSFHATAFSLIFRKQFVVFNRQEHINTRMRDLLYGLGLRDCLMDSAGRDCPRIDYPQILEKLDEKVSVSKAYIENVLSEGKR